MKVSTKTRYGIRAMLQLALEHGGGPVSVRDIAEKQGLPVKYLEQLVATLKNSGLITAIRGAGGGYMLSRAPEEIPLSEVFVALEGSLAPVDCVEDPMTCPREHACATRGVWMELREAMHGVLDNTTLADLAADSRRTGGPEGAPPGARPCDSTRAVHNLLRKA